MSKNYGLVNLRLSRFELLAVGMLLFANAWIDYLPSCGLVCCKLVLTFPLQFPHTCSCVLLEGENVTGRGGHQVIVLNGWG